MTICDMKKGMRALVLKVEAGEAVRERLRFLGIFKGAKVALIKTSLWKSTYLVQAGGARVALVQGRLKVDGTGVAALPEVPHMGAGRQDQRSRQAKMGEQQFTLLLIPYFTAFVPNCQTYIFEGKSLHLSTKVIF